MEFEKWRVHAGKRGVFYAGVDFLLENGEF